MGFDLLIYFVLVFVHTNLASLQQQLIQEERQRDG